MHWAFIWVYKIFQLCTGKQATPPHSKGVNAADSTCKRTRWMLAIWRREEMFCFWNIRSSKDRSSVELKREQLICRPSDKLPQLAACNLSAEQILSVRQVAVYQQIVTVCCLYIRSSLSCVMFYALSSSSSRVSKSLSWALKFGENGENGENGATGNLSASYKHAL